MNNTVKAILWFLLGVVLLVGIGWGIMMLGG